MILGKNVPSYYGGLKEKCIFRQAKAKLKMEKKMTLPILTQSPVLQCKQSAQSTADHNKKGWRGSTEERDAFSFPRMNFSFKPLYHLNGFEIVNSITSLLRQICKHYSDN